MKAFKSYIAPDKAAAEASMPSTVQPSTPSPKLQSEKPGPYRSNRASARQSTVSLALTAGMRDKHASSINDLWADVTVHSLYQDQLRKMYASAWNLGEGCVLKKGRNDYVCAPPQLATIPNGFFDMVGQLNVSCAMTVNTPVIQSIIHGFLNSGEQMASIPLSGGLQLQVLQRMTDLPRCQKHHFAAYILDPPLLVVWDDDANKLHNRAESLEEMIIAHIWRSESADEEEADEKNEKQPKVGVEELSPAALEEALRTEARPTRVVSSALVALALGLSITCLGLGWRSLALEVTVDGSYARLGLVAMAPVTFFMSLFFFISIAGVIFQVFGPISSINANSANYSGKPPRRLNPYQQQLPHVTFQMPVYKEGLSAVIKPTVLSLKAAISTYEMQGGSATILVNDDGMQLIDPEEAAARKEFYNEHNIGWIARPGHNPKPEDPAETPFIRRGRFKKASNMNYALMTSNKLEERLNQVDRGSNWNQESEDRVYEQALAQIIEESEGRTWAGGNIRIGDYILLIDSDTRVPRDCLLDAVSEMEASPEVAILQYTSGVMNVSDSFFEQAVTWFTEMIYAMITFNVANGDISPFVGHNAVLRWSAIQDAASYIDEDGYEKFWSESHVSEDFDMALRLQTAGYIIRYGAYTGDGFQEGVSLTVYDELARWEKYAYGCNELLFHPLRFWPTRGPFTPLFRRFLTSNIAFFRKLTIVAYIGTYYAIGASWILTWANYFITGWFNGVFDKYYLDSFAIYFALIIVFPLCGNVALAVLRYRLGQQSLIAALWNNFKWMPIFTIFLGGISLHVSKALLCHFFEINIQWGATSKEVERCNFMEEIPKIIKSFAGTFIYTFAGTALIVCGIYVFPPLWQINTFATLYPVGVSVVSHFALPVLLNPALMKFTF
ncbi:glycosyl transferase family group 2-domain-containing protein [Colletotrichum navitas]|uniref:Glycosyl transferase family group 2-domain-containing protein n=1 Tax=Colletotrichum navitas TaxID=681940 RepID=A0AAD8Q9N3_9PEZI|nr:glycosyl transferase family group 2-domain-containing protein [Colletotrichum navitas]KAK1598568.1 glycosyl transferase family group 2-domain-containing protein [Colletotrichum navitas]